MEYETGWRELYDLERDPSELRNLADEEESEALRASLHARLQELLAR